MKPDKEWEAKLVRNYGDYYLHIKGHGYVDMGDEFRDSMDDHFLFNSSHKKTSKKKKGAE